MGYRDEVLTYFDSDHLMSRRPNATPNEEGNPILETGTAYAIMSWLGQATKFDADSFIEAVTVFQKEPGLPNKKPRSNDLITHDDIIGLIAGSVALKKFGCKFHLEVYEYGINHGWKFTNNGTDEFESYAKPWHIAFYTLAADHSPSLWSVLSLAFSILVDAFFNMTDASSKRITYLMIKTISGKNLLVDLASAIWRIKVDIKKVFIAMKTAAHPFSIYCPK